MLVSDFLDLFGWRHDRTGPTGKPFGSAFDVLGLTLDLTGLRNDRSVILRNKEGRVEKIASKIVKVKDSGVMSLSDAQEIHGLLNFATGYFAGRSLKYACFRIFSLVDKGDRHLPQLQSWCDEALLLLDSVKPRTIPVSISTSTVLVFTDGSWESNVAGLGAVLLNESTGNRLVVQDRVQDGLLDLWRDLVGDQLICQIELFAMVLVRWEWQLELSNRWVLLFVIVKGRSNLQPYDG
jgi:hypothetical protein